MLTPIFVTKIAVIAGSTVAVDKPLEVKPLALPPALAQVTADANADPGVALVRILHIVTPATTKMPSLQELVTKELDYYRSSGELAQILQLTKDALTTIPQTSVEAKRAFSASGHFLTKVGSRMANEILSLLCFLTHFFIQNVMQ